MPPSLGLISTSTQTELVEQNTEGKILVTVNIFGNFSIVMKFIDKADGDKLDGDDEDQFNSLLQRLSFHNQTLSKLFTAIWQILF